MPDRMVTPIPKPAKRPPKPRRPLARSPMPATSRRRRPQAPETPREPCGLRECVGPERGLPGPCWGGLHRHHTVLRSQGGRGELVWLCLQHHTGRYGVHTLVALAKQLGLYGT